ncbi:MAG: ATP-dependent DNA ligase [Deltaproteobacteria bacterium]|nr:ATP-dependent DNA ligase [Deltaproteobacteria bacterium]
MRLGELVETSRQVGATRKRLEKLALLAELIRRLAREEVRLGVAYLAGELGRAPVGAGPALVRAVLGTAAAPDAALTLVEVDRALAAVARASGSGSSAQRRRALEELFARATAPEQSFLARLIVGELRQGALEGLLVQAVARAATLDEPTVRRAWMVSGDLPGVAELALRGGREALAGLRLRPGVAVKPMLAQDAGSLGEVLTDLGEAAFEWKLDGARVQVHKDGDEVRVFTRQLNDVTAAVPEIVAVTRALPARTVILDGETIALEPDGGPHPFQVTMRRFGRKLDVEALRAELPLTTYFFDVLHLDDADLLDRPAAARFHALAEALPPALVIPRVVTGNEPAAQAFLESALDRGHEGVVAKTLAATYEAGRRGGSWRKLKPVHTLDLVVLAAEWGSGRRQGWLSNLHLGARDPANGGFVMLGKTFKGLTDERLAWQTEKLLALELGRDEWTVHVRPELVVEIAFGDVQSSARYPGGVALRFARVKRYRADKSPADADTIDAVRAIHARGTAEAR